MDSELADLCISARLMRKKRRQDDPSVLSLSLYFSRVRVIYSFARAVVYRTLGGFLSAQLEGPHRQHAQSIPDTVSRA